MRILFVASEGLPFSKTGGLADVIEALPKALAAAATKSPCFCRATGRRRPRRGALRACPCPWARRCAFRASWTAASCNGVQYFFVDDPEYFDRDQLYGTARRDYPDNAERFAEFSRAAIELAKHVWMPDVIHCHDWQSALVPVLLRTQYDDDPRAAADSGGAHHSQHGLPGRVSAGGAEAVGLPESLFRPERRWNFTAR